MQKVISQLSGGFDSVASTLLVAETGVEFQALFFDINQPYYLQELKAVTYVDSVLRERYPNYKGLHIASAMLQLHASEGPSEYIPVRNLVLGAISANYALAKNYTAVAVGNKTLEIRENDPYCFKDCSRSFYTQLGDLATFASEGHKVEFLMPLIFGGVPMTKKEVIEYIHNRGLEVRNLWSCYRMGEKPCGECYHCQEVKATGLWHYFE